jgi:hypothetical protein
VKLTTRLRTVSTGTRLGVGMACAVLALTVAAPVHADTPSTLADATRARTEAQSAPEAATDRPAPAEDPAAEVERLAEQWGIEVTSVRMTMHDHMIDFRYRVLDPVKAKELFVRQNKPALIHQETGKVLAVPETAKVGPLRNSNTPQEGKIYWMFFGNANNLVQAGDKVTVVIGEFRVEDLLVE